jgi:hypothetical protein
MNRFLVSLNQWKNGKADFIKFLETIRNSETHT